METKRATWLEVLSAVQPGLAKKEIIEEASHFVFTGTRVMTFNDDVAVSYPFKTKLKCSIEAESLYGTLKVNQNDELVIDMKLKRGGEGATITFKGERGEGELAAKKDSKLLAHIDLIGLDKVKSWKNLPKDFMEGLRLCSFSASRDMGKDWMTCIIIEGKQMYSTDDYRVSSYTLASKLGGPLYLPCRAGDALLDFNLKKYHHDKRGWLHFQDDRGVMFSARLMKIKNMPDFTAFLAIKGQKFSFPAAMAPFIKEAQFQTRDDTTIEQKIEISIDGNLIELKGQGERGWSKNKMEIDYKGAAINFHVNPTFFAEILKHSTKVEIEKGKCVFTSGKKFIHAMALPIV
jgi:hypothetical protein